MATAPVTCQAVLLRRTPFSDTSFVVHWFSQERGKIKTVAKGARRPDSPFRGKLDLFYHCEIFLGLSSKSDLHPLREVVVRESFELIRSTYLRTTAASYFAELVDMVTEPELAVPEIYQLLLRALHYLDQKHPERRGVRYFEFELCRSLGIQAETLVLAEQRLREVFGRLPHTHEELIRLLGET